MTSFGNLKLSKSSKVQALALLIGRLVADSEVCAVLPRTQTCYRRWAGNVVLRKQVQL